MYSSAGTTFTPLKPKPGSGSGSFVILNFTVGEYCAQQLYNINASCTACQHYNNIMYYPVDISTTVFSYSRAVQYHTILHG